MLRILGIYDIKELQTTQAHFWDVIGREFGRRGKIYRKRCVHLSLPWLRYNITFRRCQARSQARNTGNNVFYPLSFPPHAEDSELAVPLTASAILDKAEVC